MPTRNTRPQVESGLPQAPGLKPVAKAVDSYDPRLTKPMVEYGRPDPHNSWMDLARGLGQLEPTLLQYQRTMQHNENFDKEAEGHELYERTKAENSGRVAFKDAVSQGLIPAGANPYLVKGYQRANLRDLASDYQLAVQQAYMNDDKVRNSDDPAVLTQFAQGIRDKFRTDFLSNEDGSQNFSPLDLHEVFYPAEEHVESQLRSQHITYRVEEHERKAEETASIRTNRWLDNFSEQAPPGFRPEWMYENAATRINQEFYHETEGLVPNGMDGKKASRLIIDNITNHAMKTGDTEVLNILKHIKTPGGSMDKTTYAKDKILSAEEHIASVKQRQEQWRWAQEAHKWHLSPEEEARRREEDYARKLEMTARSDEQYAHEKRGWLGKDVREMVDLRSKSEVSRVLTAVRMKDMDNPMLHTAMSWLRTEDPEAYMNMEKYINTLTKEKQKVEDSPENRIFHAQLRYDMSNNPENFNPSRIFRGVADQHINPDVADKMFDDWERIRKNMDNPYMQHPEFVRMLDTARAAVKKSAGDEYSAGALKSQDAVIALRSYSQAWIEDHPDGKQTDFLKSVNSYIAPIMLQADEDYKAEQKAKKDAEEKPTPQPQPQRGTIGKITDSLGITKPPAPVPDLPPKKEPLPKFTPRHVSELMTKPQRDEVTGMIQELRKDKDVKITERDLRDRLVPIFTDIYTKHGRDVLDALEGVDGFVQTLVKTKKKPKE